MDSPASRSRAGQITWARRSDIPPGAATAEQVALMDSLVNGTVSAPEFARSWLAARREALWRNERLREPFSAALDRVFWALEDYSIDPALRDETDLTDPELVATIRAVLSEIDRLG
ncbi:colicin immunity domain-containing protein [Streptomyces sp. NPDC051018]|uniref:colicin immunity domain-containing protein n=1 Tax=Streptomyces sp. NPDC051018 TaxID=3365639 RepID=UPI0037884747